SVFLSSLTRRHPLSPLFPYTTLFRSKGWQSMITLFEVLAMVTLAGLGAMFFRRRIRRGSALALVFAGLCTVLAMPTGASATELRDRKSTRLNSSHEWISYAVFCLKQK